MSPMHVIDSSSASQRLFVASIIARTPLAMLSIGLLVHAQHLTGSLAQAGVVAGAYAIALGAGAPLLGRLIDRRGQTSVLLASASTAAALLVTIALLPASAPLVVLVAFAAGAGLAAPPVGACLRTQLPSLLSDPGAARNAFALEASLAELTYVIGPPLALSIGAMWSSGAALAIGGLGTLAATAVFAAQPASRTWRAPPADRSSRGGSLRTPDMRTLVIILIAVGMLLGAGEVAVIAAAGTLHSTIGAAPLFAVWGAGSFTGGLLATRFGGGARTAAGRGLLLGALTAGHLALIAADSSMGGLAVALFLAGTAIAPTEATLSAMVDNAAPAGMITEAFAWLATAMAVGGAIGVAGAGVAADRAGPSAAFAVAGASGALALVTNMLRSRTMRGPLRAVSANRTGHTPSRRPLLTAAVCAVTLVTSVAALDRPALMHRFTRDLPRLRTGQWWRIITPLLVQPSGWGQLVFNILGIAVVGAALQRRFGWASWSLVYLAGGAGSIAIYSHWHPADTGGGSSAAVAALIGALAIAENIDPTPGRLQWCAELYSMFFAVYLTTLDLAGVTASIIAGNAMIVALVVIEKAVKPTTKARGSLIVVLAASVAMTLAHDDHGAGLAIGVTLAGLVFARRSIFSRSTQQGWRQTAVALTCVVGTVLLTWVAWVPLLGIALVKTRPDGLNTQVGWPSITLAAAAACLAASFTRRILVRRSTVYGPRVWTGLCLGVALISLAGPMTTTVGASGIAALISLHAVCTAAILGLSPPLHKPHHARPGNRATVNRVAGVPHARDPS